jgi:hypothetical protein
MSHVFFNLIACLAALPAAAALAAEEPVVLRTAAGKFVRAADDGTLRADRLLPGPQETFQLAPGSDGYVVLKAPGERLFAAQRLDAGHLRIGRFAGQGAAGASSQNVVAYSSRETSATVQSALVLALRGLVAEELGAKEYDKTRRHKTEKYINVPAPTLRHPLQTARRQVLGVEEEFRVQARLDGPADVQITRMPYLKERGQSGPGVLMFEVKAKLPLRGHVQGKVVGLASGSTGYRAQVQIAAAGQVALRRSGNWGTVQLDPPELLDVRIELHKLELSNDLLDAARRPIENVINDELRHNQDRIREQANKSLRKAFEKHEVKLPLLGFLGL